MYTHAYVVTFMFNNLFTCAINSLTLCIFSRKANRNRHSDRHRFNYSINRLFIILPKGY